jgi:outer membrane receptor protein involved in Fe transport
MAKAQWNTTRHQHIQAHLPLHERRLPAIQALSPDKLKFGSQTLTWLSLPLLAFCQAGDATAQTAPQVQAAPATPIVITANRRSQTVDTVPIAVTALSDSALDAAAIRDTQDLTRLAPGLVITVGGAEATASTIRLRGVGTSGSNLGLEGSVGVFMDGVYFSRQGIGLSELHDISRVEVLRGPQGTLFGKNVSAGALLIQTRQPEFAREAQATVAIGERNSKRVSAVYGDGLIDDKVAFRVSGVVHKSDGFLNDVGTGQKYNDRDRMSLRGQLRIEPSSNVSLRLIADYAEKNEKCCAATTIVNGSRTAIISSLGGFVPADPKGLDVAANGGYIANSKEAGLSGRAAVNLGPATWQTIVSYRDYKSLRAGDAADYINLDLLTLPGERTNERFTTVESTLRGDHGSLDWLVGAYYFRQRTDQASSLVYGADLARFFQRVFPTQATLLAPLYPIGGGDTSRNFFQSANGASIFTHNIITLAEGWKATLGARSLSESKEGGGRFTFNSPSCRTGVPAGAQSLCPVPNFDSSFKDTASVGTAALSFEPRRNSILYAGYSRGYKAGGINLDRSAGLGGATGATFQPEVVDSYEVGAKASFMRGAARLSVTYFTSNIRNFQQNAFNGTTFVISNAAEVNSKGLEVEAGWRPYDWLGLGSSVLSNSAVYGPATVDATLRGRQIVNAPKLVWQNQIEVERPWVQLGPKVFFNLNTRQQSDVNTSTSLVAEAQQKGYTLVGARIGLRAPRGAWEVSAFGQNLTNVYYRTIVFAGTAQPGTYQAYIGAPRMLGLEAKLRF